MKKTILLLCAIAFCGAVTLKADDTAPKKPKLTPEEMFKKLDTNADGFLSKDEFMASPQAKKDPTKAEERYKKMDKAGDGKVTLEEYLAVSHKKKDPAAPATPAPAEPAK